MPIIERRYAEALIDISESKGGMELFQSQLGEITELFMKQSDFRMFLLNPEVKNEVKKNILKQLLDGKAETEMQNFLLLLIDKDRIRYLPGILGEYSRLADMRRNSLEITVMSAVGLDDTRIERIRQKYMELYKAREVRVYNQVDPALIGGIKIKIGDKVIDGSIKGRLEGLKEILTVKS